MPRGGKRPGAGRKPKIPKPPGQPPGRVLVHPSSPPSAAATVAPVSPVEHFDPPDGLAPEERDVWVRQATHAFMNRTLTRATALAFERYCRVVVLERNESKSSGVGGANHRGLLKQINTYELQFGLTANGRPLTEFLVPATTADEDEDFFGGPRASQQPA